MIFNTVINTLTATQKLRKDLGSSISLSHPVNLLQYADDTCIIANIPAAGKARLASTDRWLQWADLKAKVPKCHAMCLKSSRGELIDLHLTISDQPLQLIANTTTKFLGLAMQAPKDHVSTKSELKSLLQTMLTAVNEAPLTHQETETQTLQDRNLSQVELASQHQ